MRASARADGALTPCYEHRICLHHLPASFLSCCSCRAPQRRAGAPVVVDSPALLRTLRAPPALSCMIPSNTTRHIPAPPPPGGPLCNPSLALRLRRSASISSSSRCCDYTRHSETLTACAPSPPGLQVHRLPPCPLPAPAFALLFAPTRPLRLHCVTEAPDDSRGTKARLRRPL